MERKIFISYSREDYGQIFPIVEKLREAGLEVWIDQEGIHGAKLWSQEIVSAIEDSVVFILFASEKAFASKNVTKELALASESDKKILPVFIEQAEIPAAMKYQLAGIQHLSHEKGQANETVGKIVTALDTSGIKVSETHADHVNNLSGKPNKSYQVFLGGSLIIMLLVILSLIYYRNGTVRHTAKTPSMEMLRKSTIDVCVVTVSEDSKAGGSVVNNQSLRDNVVSKLSLFRDYKIIQGSKIAADSNADELISLADKHNADYILQTNIDNTNSIVNAKIIDGKNGRILWTKHLSKSPDESELQFFNKSSNIIASNVAGYDGCLYREVLQKAIAKNEELLSAVELLQIGKSIWEDVTHENLHQAILKLEKCVELCPDSATAYAVSSDVYYAFIRNEIPYPDALAKSENNLKQAIKLDPKNAIVICTKFWIEWDRGDIISSEVLAEEAIRANPNEPWALATYAWFLVSSTSDLEEGLKYAEKALEFCEHPQGWYYWAMAEYYRLKKDYKECLKYLLKTTDQYRDWYYIQTATCNWLIGNKNTALKIYKELLDRKPDFSIEEYRNNRFIYEGRIVDDFENAFDSLLNFYEISKSQSTEGH